MTQYVYFVGYSRAPAVLTKDTNIFSRAFKYLSPQSVNDKCRETIISTEAHANSHKIPYVFFNYYAQTGCRESLLYYLGFLYQEKKIVESKFNYDNPVGFVIIDKENDFSMTESWLRAVQNFSRKFINRDPKNEFKIHVRNCYGSKRVAVSFEFPSEEKKRALFLAKLSYILWILRKPQILEFANKFASDKNSPGTLSDLMKILAFEFLKNKDWGNTSNCNLALALFSHFCISEKHLGGKTSSCSGPEHYTESHLTDSAIQNFADELATGIYKTEFQIPTNDLNTSNLSSDLLRKISSAFRLAVSKRGR